MVKMNQILKTGLLGATLAIGFTGCLGSKPAIHKQMNNLKVDKINLEYKFQDELQSNSISQREILDVIKDNISSNSKYIKKVIKHNPTRNTYGYIVEYKDNVFTINYVNGNQNCGNYCNSKYGQVTQVIFDVKLNIKEKSKNDFLIQGLFPQEYTIKPDSNVFGFEFSSLDNLNNLEKDAKRMFNSLKDKPLQIKRSIEFKSEVNTKYPDKAVYANFKRILGSYSWRNNENISDVKKQNSFNLKVNGKSYPLHVEVYPYRDGSKVTYSTNLEYTVDSKGGSTLNVKDIKELHKKIENIINN